MLKSVRARVTSGYYALTGAEKRVADYVLEHSYHVQFMSITELASEAGVSEASVSRFCRTLAFDGFNAFKLELAKDLADAPAKPAGQDSAAEVIAIEYENVIRRTCNMLDVKLVDRAVDILASAGKVCMMGHGGSLFTALEAWSVFTTVSPKFVCVQDSHLQSATAALLDENDAIMYFSYSGATRAALEVLPLVRERQVKVILFTRYKLSPAANYADVVLQCGADESPMQLGSVAARISQLFLVDVLFDGFCRRDIEGTAANRERIARALNVKHM